MQEEIENRTVNLAIQCSELSLRSLINGIRTYQTYMQEKDCSKITHGRKTLKELINQGQSVTSIPVGDEKVKELEQIMKKYGIDYAFIKDKSSEPPQYTMFFQAKDAEVLNEVLKDCTELEFSKKEHKGIEEILKGIKERIGKAAEKEPLPEKEPVR